MKITPPFLTLLIESCGAIHSSWDLGEGGSEGNYCGFSDETAKQEAPGGHGGRDAQKAARPGEVRREIWSRGGICV